MSETPDDPAWDACWNAVADMPWLPTTERPDVMDALLAVRPDLAPAVPTGDVEGLARVVFHTWTDADEYEVETIARAILASDWLAARDAQVRAEGARAVVDRVEAVADDLRAKKERAANWAARTSEGFREAMSCKVAYEYAENELRAALDPEAGGDRG